MIPQRPCKTLKHLSTSFARRFLGLSEIVVLGILWLGNGLLRSKSVWVKSHQLGDNNVGTNSHSHITLYHWQAPITYS